MMIIIPRQRRARLCLVATAIACVAASAVACSSAPGSTSAASAGGAPIEFGSISATGPGTEAADVLALPGLDAAVAAINASGGINGRPLKLDFCDTHGNVNQAAACASKLAANKSIVATVANDNFSGNQEIDSLLGQAGVASIGPDVTTPEDYSDPLVYPLHAGAIASFSGGMALLAAHGFKDIAAACYQVPAVPPAVKFTQDTILPKFPGVKLVGTQFVPVTATDMTSYAAALIASHPDGIYESVGTQTVAFARALREQGYKGPIVMSSAVVGASQLKQLGSSAGELMLNSNTAHSGLAWDQYQADLSKYEPSAAAGVGDAALWDWMAVQLFAKALGNVHGSITRASIVQALNGMSSYTTGGLTPSVNLAEPGAVPGYSRIFNPTVYGLTYSNGQLTDIKPVTYINMFTGVSTRQ